MSNRRSFVRNAINIGAGLLSASRMRGAPAAMAPVHVQTPNLPDLPFTMENGVKVFHLVAEPVRQQIAPGKTANLWGFNGSSPGPTIQVTQGDRVRLIVDNHLPEATSMHWHGFEIPIDMDGSPGISQQAIAPGGRFVYEFTLHQQGTYFYHSHMAMQEMIGSLGAFIMHPKTSYSPRVDQDFALMLQEYSILANNTVPNTMSMEFNWLVINGKAGPAVTPMIVRLGHRVRIRIINLGMDHHPMHLHGNTFQVTGTEAGRIPESAWFPGNTVLVGVAQARDIEFDAQYPGDWMFHCHLPHHMMNQMSSNGPAGQPISNAPLSHTTMAGMDMDDVARNASKVPGFPQDAYMEGPAMAMDDMVKKPENGGLPAGWSGFAQGMMTFVRVLPPDKYDEIMQQIQKSNGSMPGMRM